MVMLKLATDDPRKRFQAQQMQGIPAPRGVTPKSEPSALQRASKVALDRGIGTIVDKGGPMAMKAGKSIMGSLMPAAPAAEAAIAADPTLIAGGIPTELTTGIMTGGKAGAGLMSSLGAAGTAAMASPAAPIVGSLLAMKMLGLFSGGGHVGPLYKAEGGDTGGGGEKDTGTKILEELEEQLRKKKAAKEDRSTLLPSFGGNISKVEYKSAGGETYKLSYGGGPLSKGA